MRAGIRRPFVEPDASDAAVHAGAELDARLDRASDRRLLGGGVVDGVQMLHGHVFARDVDARPGPGVSMLPLSSTARLLIRTVPAAGCVVMYVQFAPPVAACHVAPPSTETSTPATTPPPMSVAVPLTTTSSPCGNVAPSAGDTIVELGGPMSSDAVAAISGACSEAGCTPMSANRLTVACCTSWCGDGCGTADPRS